MGKAVEKISVKLLQIVCVLIFIVINVSGLHAQARVGSKATDIATEFSHKGIQYDRANDGTRYLWYSDKSVFVGYYLDENSICTSTIIIPNSQGVLNWYCEKFNKEAVIISDTQWKLYTKGGVMYIQLIYTDDGAYYFRLY